ncbi:MAG: DUF177 domain-containing protein [Bacteroidetes bacterium]|nr:DUF177 domain-containing protein [Bacteroidota bacterium]
MQAEFFKEGKNVAYLDQFIIPYYGLKPGWHHYDFEIEDAFFEAFEYSEIHKGKIMISVDLEKQERMFILHFDIKGILSIPCDRCLDDYDQYIEGKEQLIIKLGNARREDAHDILVIPENEHSFNISPFIYEYLVLLLPARRVHPDDENGNSTCNPEVLAILEKLRYQPKTDPRWEGLNQLKNDHNNTN